MFKNVIKINLEDSNYFDFGNGLWKGKKPPFKKVIVIRNTNFTDSGKINLSNVAVLEVEEIQFDKKNLKSGDIIIERSGGGPKQPVGRVVFFDLNHGDYSFSNFTSRIRVINQSFDPNFIFYFLHNFYQEGMTEKFQAHTTGIRNLDFNKYKEAIYVPLLPLSEQNKITYLLNTVQKAIEQQDKLIRTTTELKKALMQKLFTEGTRSEPQEETDIGLLPESWDVASIGDMYTFTKKPRGLNIQTPVPFIPMELVPLSEMKIENYELRDKVSSGTYVENGDLLLAKITPSFENGKQGFVSIDKPCAYATTEVIPIKDIEKLSDKFYLFYYLLKEDIRNQLTSKMEGSTGRQRLSKTILEQTLIPKPSLNEQKKIAELLISFDKKISYCNKKKQTLTALLKTLLHELMTGQRRVHELEFEKMEDFNTL